MRKLFQKIQSLSRSKDELCGKWVTEDGSGFSMIMGSWIEFKSDGTGNYQSWSSSNDDTGYDLGGEFQWNRQGKSQIEILELDDLKKTVLDYKLEKVGDRLELSNMDVRKVGEIQINEFWNFAQIMFKSR